MRAPIDGSVILITGASSGIGAELARQLAPRAGALILLARRKDRLEALKQELLAQRPSLKVCLISCDLADEASIQAAFTSIEEAYDRVDLLINNAGIGEKGLFERGNAARTEEILRVNILAVARFTRRYLPGMVSRGRGGVMNVGSGAGFIPMPGAATYVGSKYFINGFSQNLYVELAGTGIVVTHVAPGPVETEFNQAAGFERFGSAGWIGISAEQCAREAIRGFERGKFLVFPGTRYKIFMFLMTLMPSIIKHRILQNYSKRQRQKKSPQADNV